MSTKPTLQFPITSETKGKPITAERLSVSSVVREMIQNSLDARSGETVKVKFEVDEIKTSEIPGIDEYKKALKTAKRNWKEKEQVLQYLKDIESAANQKKQSVLFVKDNGIGLNKRRMEAVLSEGSPEKEKGSTGSYGSGHLTAYGLSKLQYIFYLGVCQDDDGEERFAGHAVLSTFKDGKNLHSCEGYYVKKIRKGELFGRYDYGSISDVPCFIQKKAGNLKSGTVIAVIGFDLGKFLEEAEKAVLLNFALAVHAGWLDVEVRSNGESIKINRTNISSRLEEFSQKEAEREKKRFLAVLNNLKTFEEGTKKTLPEPFQDCEVIIRHENGLRSRVAIWRNGMIITDTHTAFQKVNFEGRKPFDAIVVLDGKREGKAHDLVRDAESRLHDKVDGKIIQDEERRRLLTSSRSGGLLNKIRDLIKKHTDKINMEETELDDFIISTPGIEERIEIARRRAITRPML